MSKFTPALDTSLFSVMLNELETQVYRNSQFNNKVYPPNNRVYPPTGENITEILNRWTQTSGETLTAFELYKRLLQSGAIRKPIAEPYIIWFDYCVDMLKDLKYYEGSSRIWNEIKDFMRLQWELSNKKRVLDIILNLCTHPYCRLVPAGSVFPSAMCITELLNIIFSDLDYNEIKKYIIRGELSDNTEYQRMSLTNDVLMPYRNWHKSGNGIELLKI
jgi:hypothetical protein